MNHLGRMAGVLALVLWGGVRSEAADQPTIHSFQRIPLADQYFCEGATFADVNRDGNVDAIAGPYWYAGPKFRERTEIYSPRPFDINGYSDTFFTFAHDVDSDGWLDAIVIGFPGKEAFWYRNPGNKPGHWQRHLAFPTVDNESPTVADLTGDGRPELVFHTAGRFGYAEIPQGDPTQPWAFQAISDERGYDRFNHGLGVGDLNGDSRADVLEKSGWWEQPAEKNTNALWKFHRVPFCEAGGAQLLVYDFDGDGDNDVLTSKNAHGYGLAWFEQVGKPGDRGEQAKAAEPAFEEHLIMGEKPDENDYGVAFSQLHALALADVDGDGVQDVVTGKRFWAHGEHDPGSLEPAVLYWFKTVRDDNGQESGSARFVPQLIDTDSGVGTQVVAADANGDSLTDLVVGNKKGVYVFLQRTEPTDAATLQATQRRPQQRLLDASAEKLSKLIGGVAPQGAEGTPLNLDFETGNLADWKADGPAFASQPIRGDTVRPRRGDMTSGHADSFWVGSYEIAGDEAQGTLTSTNFELSKPFATFLVGGGSSEATRVEIVREDTNEVVFKASGGGDERMQLATADLHDHLGKPVFIRVVDESSGAWGHVNFDHFRLHDERPKIDSLPNAAPAAALGAKDEYPFANISAEEAAAAMKMPAGFSAKVFAAEPDVQQPIAMTFDDRGRVWIAEAYEYPIRAPGNKGRDRILIFEDTDGDGRFDKKKVFAEGLNLVSGLEIGFGGVWVGAAPYLMFIPDRNGDDVPDGKPEILLDGWGWQDTHETLNTFNWGPDGWLYGCHGVFTHSRVGKPGTPDSERVPLNAAIWRYHPTRHQFEVFSQGTSNPWGIDFNDWGQLVSTACVIPHLFHNIQGARYNRQAGEHFNQHTYADIPTIADHLHYLGNNPHAANERSDQAGGGHAHAGAMIYLGGAWPAEYRNQIFMNNIHGQRLNMDILRPQGSGLVGSHGPDFLLTQDKASQMLNFRYGPDGQVFVIDWYDMQACHDPHADAHDRTNGRIYKIIYGVVNCKSPQVDLTTLSDLELSELMLNENDWYVRHARRILQERAANKPIDANAIAKLTEIATTNADEKRRLRALWALHGAGQLTDDLLAKSLKDENQYVRAWAIQLALDGESADATKWLPQFMAMAANDPSPVVRLYLASAAQRIPLADRWEILDHLAHHAEDAGDHNLPLMIWYAAEPLGPADPERALAFGLGCGKTLPLVRDFMLRRIASVDSPAALAALVDGLSQSSDTDEQLAILGGIRQALRGQRQVAPPANWAAAYQHVSESSNQEVRDGAIALGVTFGDAAAMDSLRHLAENSNENVAARRAAIESLLGAKDPQLPSLLEKLLGDTALRDLAIMGLAQYDVPQTPSLLLNLYPQLSPSEKRAALATLSARPASGVALLSAVAAGKIATADLPADLVRQLTNHKNEEIDRLVADLWGTVRSTPADKIELMASLKEKVTAAGSTPPDPMLGRAVFAKTCGQCHTLYGVGANIGPDLTGSNRGDIDYLLSNIVDPSAIMAKEYQPSIIITLDGRVVTGIVTKEDDKSITVQTATEAVLLPKDEIEERELSDVSMMPDDQLKQFDDHETLSLFAYLMGKAQVPMLATKDNASGLFNGRDLAGWSGDPELWTVENGEIVGRSPGIPHNSFLVSDLQADDFKLSFDVKLVDNVGNSGVQFRSVPVNGYHELEGYQADAGAGWWGKLYEEHGRELLWDKSGEEFLKPGEWNHYEIRAEGSHIQTWLNGHKCVDLFDPNGKRRGQFGLQIHSGPALEVRFRNLQLEVLGGN
jgi:putative membrane-bound dehydrogenase-like protein